MIERTIDCAVNLPISYGQASPTTALRQRTTFGEPIQINDRRLLLPCPEHNRTMPTAEGCCDREELRHILLGSPGAIRQAIHQFHILDYAESGLWSPIVMVRDRRIIVTSDQGEAMSLLRR